MCDDAYEIIRDAAFRGESIDDIMDSLGQRCNLILTVEEVIEIAQDYLEELIRNRNNVTTLINNLQTMDKEKKDVVNKRIEDIKDAMRKAEAEEKAKKDAKLAIRRQKMALKKLEKEAAAA